MCFYTAFRHDSLYTLNIASPFHVAIIRGRRKMVAKKKAAKKKPAKKKAAKKTAKKKR
jgi:hypothetical protein